MCRIRLTDDRRSSQTPALRSNAIKNRQPRTRLATMLVNVRCMLTARRRARTIHLKLAPISAVILAATSLPLRAEVDTARPCEGTPYDAYMGPMRQTYARLGDGSPSISDVRSQLRTAYRFRYYFDPAQPYTPQTPEVTESRQQGDCKAKSLWLLSKMDERDVRYVMGKAKVSSRISHVWLLWQNGGKWIILDPTSTADIIEADRVVGKKDIPKYSYDSRGTYKHPTYSEYIKN